MKGPRTAMRKVACPECGYTIRMARSWMSVGMPTCPCGQPLNPTEPADLAFIGVIGPEDMSTAMWTAICRENGWEDAIQRKGAAAKSWVARRALIRTAPADHCVYPGCGRWVAANADRCTAGHGQHEDAPAVEALPF